MKSATPPVVRAVRRASRRMKGPKSLLSLRRHLVSIYDDPFAAYRQHGYAQLFQAAGVCSPETIPGLISQNGRSHSYLLARRVAARSVEESFERIDPKALSEALVGILTRLDSIRSPRSTAWPHRLLQEQAHRRSDPFLDRMIREYLYRSDRPATFRLVHGDLAPSNLLWTARGHRLWVVDFDAADFGDRLQDALYLYLWARRAKLLGLENLAEAYGRAWDAYRHRLDWGRERALFHYLCLLRRRAFCEPRRVYDLLKREFRKLERTASRGPWPSPLEEDRE